MKETKTFIYITNEEYFQKTFTLEKTSVRTKDVYFNLKRTKGLKKTSQKVEMHSEVNKLISNNDVIFADTNISTGEFIITTGGVVFGDKLPASIMKEALKKENRRIMEIDNFFQNNAYIQSYIEAKFNSDNKELIIWLLELEKKLLTGKTLEKEEVYSKLLNALIETPQPIRTDNYEKNIKQLQKEYSNA